MCDGGKNWNVWLRKDIIPEGEKSLKGSGIPSDLVCGVLVGFCGGRFSPV